MPRLLCYLLLLALALPARGGDEPRTVPDDHARRMAQGLQLFDDRVGSVLRARCLACHGGERTEGGLDLASRESLLASGFVAADAASSHLMAVVRHAAEPHMPKDAARLGDDDLAALARWIDLGAPYSGRLVERGSPGGAAPAAPSRSGFWSFQPLAVVSPPETLDDSWSRTPIDRFVLARLEERGLRPNPPSDRRTLIRRVYATLLGLRPPAEEVEQFVADPDPAAYERLVDGLLESPRYGERWARHWLDVARFAESHGYEQDYDRPHAYAYRDFLIRAFNDDLPYDRFVRWQVAGDELAPDEPQAWAATGFLGAGAFPTQLTEAEFERARYDELDDMTSTVGAAFLGLSVGCARCHDHKFDPITTRDYYRLAATFATTIRSDRDLPARGDWPGGVAQVTSEGQPHQKHHADDRGYPHFYPEVYQLKRGDPGQKLDVAQAGFLPILVRDGDDARWRRDPPPGSPCSYRRAALADWLVDPRHGAGALAARVMVNRLWAHHLGRGLVETPNDFGAQGARPSHPELLEWLAADLVHHGWRLKRVQRLIVTSAAFRQSGDVDPPRQAADRDNALVWRFAPRRLEGEAIRDSFLATAGLLDPTMYGAGTLDPAMRRRSVYFFIKRSQLIPWMMLFDWPEHLVSQGRRSATTIAPQALAMLNDPTVRDCSAELARGAAAESDEAAVHQAFRLIHARPPSPDERRLALEFLAAQRAAYPSDRVDDAPTRALADLCQALLTSNEFLYVE